MDKLYWLEKIKLQDRAEVGDKAFYLSKIMHRGYPVLPGFVIAASVLRKFLENLNSSEALVADLPHSSLHLDVNNWRQLRQVASGLRQEIINATVPPQLLNAILKAARQLETKYLIFRPSLMLPSMKQSIGSISGLLESQVCCCEPEAIAIALKQTWSQLFRARSLLYWQQVEIDLQQINFAILVQPIQNAIASGLLVANSSGWEIQATWGLGMAIAYGEVLPDSYYIHPETGAVLEQQLGNKTLAYDIDKTNYKVDLQHVSLSGEILECYCLQAYFLEEDQQKQYALPEENLQQLIGLAKQIAKEFGNNFTLKWTIPQQESSRALYLTQVIAPQLGISNFHFLKGLGAAAGRVTATAHVVANSRQKPTQIPKGVILVTSIITPDWLPILQQAGGIITEQGGLTSHAAILARELGIPAIGNLANATTFIQNGERVLIDGDKGEVYRLGMNTEEDVNKQEENSTRKQLEKLSVHQPNHSVYFEQPMTATKLLVNLSQPSLIEQVQSLPVDGVGLLRSELMLLTILDGEHPNTWLNEGRQTQLLERWCETIMQFARGFAPRPIFYRSLDWRSHEFSSLRDNLPSYAASKLGERGTFSYLANPTLFEIELTALATLQKAGYTNIHLILPFVRTLEEFRFCRQKVEQANLTQVPQFQLWIMAEVPSVLFLLPEYVKAGVQGISIGTNDLTQLLLGVDREQGQLAQAFDERHPAVMSAIAQLIRTAKEGGIPCSICGQAPALYPEIIESLVQWGITSISVEPEAFSRTYQAIARAEKSLLLEAARRQIQ
ncbi:PEP/pyruvate-binding domain-containing protein [Chlorogloeopsis sp. ULAP01]|uniref:putative PEP-binding protein n=1 Tax=Chlorogloeopsis sp. ULAP01 TaxID=3056483 RepID=UPI0025AB09F2|nr:putative PEP-binding protein [Chlorogloeopsis sp. ULAP01]MDM9381208.1 PEP/pyruvate-binding domain-containing protein [Chlorogloeopsis sp. ULAP01]